MADNKKKKMDRTSPSSDDAEIQNLKAEMAHLEQMQAEWKTSHTTESAAPLTPQTPAQRRRQERIAKRRARQQKAITDVNEFFDYQREMLAKTWQELELNVGERQKLTRMKREKRIAARKVRQKARKEASLEWRTLRKQNRENRGQNLQVTRQESKKGIADRRQEAKDHRIEKKDHTQQFREESKELRKRNWQQYVRRQRRRTKRFMKFQNRLWWKGYLTLLAWILTIFLILVGIFYLFKALGIDLIELFQTI
jgi:hypothetical protein